MPLGALIGKAALAAGKFLGKGLLKGGKLFGNAAFGQMANNLSNPQQQMTPQMLAMMMSQQNPGIAGMMPMGGMGMGMGMSPRNPIPTQPLTPPQQQPRHPRMMFGDYYGF